MEQRIEFVIRDARPDTAERLRQYALRRLTFALRRFDNRVRHVTVRILDENGPRRGVDARCSMSAELTDGRRIFVDATTARPFASITEAAERLRGVLRRELGRAAAHREHAPGMSL